MDTKEEIHSRMLRDMARLWGYQESESNLEAFDPVVGHLLSACAVEFNKLQQEMNASRSRILDRLVATLTPDLMTAATPAHAVLHAKPVDPEHVMQPTEQMYHKRETSADEKDFFFSPIGNIPVFHADVRYLASAGAIVQVDELPNRPVLSKSDLYKRGRIEPELWIGIKLHPKIKTLPPFSFFFNWRNEPQVHAYLRQLPFCRWYLGQQELAISKGLTKNPDSERAGFEAEFSPGKRMEKRIAAHYDGHFIGIKNEWNGKPILLDGLLEHYPKSFEEIFPLEDLMRFTDKLLWLRVAFPQSFSPEALRNAECLLNCVPVLNRKFHEENFRLSDQVNILPLPCDDFFFDIQRVYSDQGKDLRSNPLSGIRRLESGTYTLRPKGVGKLDDRAASRHLQHLLDLLRDESAAFSAYNSNHLNAQIRKLNQDITDLEDKVNGIRQEDLPFLAVNPAKEERNRQITVEYWSTNGESANAIAAWTPLDLFAAKSFERESIYFVTSSTGGSNAKSPSESLFHFKKALTTRDRIISKEDIKTFCFTRIGKPLQRVDIQKGFRISDLPNEGVQRTLDVRLYFSPGPTERENVELATLCQELEVELNEKSSGLLPLRVMRV